MKLYLFEKENADGERDGVRHLDKTIALSRENHSEETEIGSVKLTEAEIQELSSLPRDQIRSRLFAKFGITDLKSHPGYPKGPYYWVDEKVYNKING
ncbi:MAG: hypothetical protein NTU58_01225 [Candidatus Nealsonbacteria bacterium]|nr:hypothetical protein [Candidatus Nealsonbacteria bacterium]